MTTTNESSRHPAIQHLVDLLTPNPNLPDKLYDVSRCAAYLRDQMIDRLQEGPELTAGLRKLLEAKDCFVRQAVIDSRADK
ncbi:hypothetical protein JF780_05650 [Mycobacterium intracellulare]|uniref:hypothetical protein n=1 Tax=Mycobacterium intracellulare TaxID=1767 RepID=UPI001CD95206|nr:hypothetical protein [Mycobacterium intracellulare]MCA2275475.1 hypothetical protein [Mycobacterium intracellulare]MCA2324435.1 hypothetical protein [Mycobacterium intracellulare]